MLSHPTHSRPRFAGWAALLLVGSLCLSIAGCGAGTDPARGDGAKPGVVTAFYPLQFISERIGGNAVTVDNLTKPGAEPHDLELSPRQVGDVEDAALVVYLKGFQPIVDEVVERQAKDRAFDASTVQPLLDGKDPHVWLDPIRLATIGDRLAARLGQIDAAHATDYTARAAALRTDLERLDAEYTQRLSTCRHREIITSHSAFQYLAQRYRLTQVGITGISPEAEPSLQRIADVAAQARRYGATTVFFETLVSPKFAETLAREVGAKTAVLDPLEGLNQPASDYLSVMRTNLTTLTAALDCS